ncbi:hypothetical protein A3F03_03780 [Candidatus Roizmanbacteria bacterium RIFCSPHIGHO2_12_FULL_41_11]|uniref:Fido domain-containing protein n=3 Tax=Candidatus Roizmaniibacteriota TaxID=1752723 RepID=A0A1F7JRR1_9BACT|nr:MAG: hypothetical protein A3F03_03780 [Candidatus Roizmanbacteria bacterium RIFCSPHIGHO2_12_FULL_41_11]OGK51094.1 MAG: hypothetical protein A2966_03970 [Candidatus Roizmanbacteria bacterium RIFCSPLOWO2_01_FULL_41_22]OGK58310.1 MAG: hypothetical protein A3H86_02910 [Candidatus Roizmanbacteria bacterium RIFCSPLOWO2_02_FULL_41_9]
MEPKLTTLTAKKQLLDTYIPLPQEIIKNLNEWFRIELTYTSNAIEGNTLTRQETALVVEEGITVQGKSIQEHLEAINHAKAFDFIQKELILKERKNITQQNILNIHSLILHKINNTDAGRYRTTAVRLRGSQTILPNPLKVPQLMDEFMQWLQGSNTDHPVKIAADAHYKLVTIHPFVDGNGRTARLLLNLLLLQAGYPPAVIRKEDRSAYINSLEKGQTGGSLDEYFTVILDAVDRSLDMYLETVKPERTTPPTRQADQRFYTTAEVAGLLQVDPETVRRYVRSGQLKAVRLGGKFIRIDKNDLNQFIDQLKSK